MGETNRELIQAKALDALKANDFTGTICLSPGTGKSYVAIQAIRAVKAVKVLICSPRTNLQKNWVEELEKWQFVKQAFSHNIFIDVEHILRARPIEIDLVNIQTCYKWNEEQINNYDLIIMDEIHTTGERYSRLPEIAKELKIRVIGLTGTPNRADEFKRDVLYGELVPIVYEYYNSERDGIINKVNYYILKYELNNDDKVLVQYGKKSWLQGEKQRYEYLENQYDKAKANMAEAGATDYFNTSLDWMRNGTPDEKKLGAQFFYAIRNRKDFLWKLNSSKSIAIALAYKILMQDPNNKVLLFSELTEQADRLSPYSLHSKNGKTAKEVREYNAKILEDFNAGRIRSLSSCHSVGLGLNITKINWAIFESYSSSMVSSRQKKGRVNRLDTDEFANVIIIVPVGTQAESWYTTAFSWIHDAIEVNSPEELFEMIKV